jgi:hypothetical protein
LEKSYPRVVLVKSKKEKMEGGKSKPNPKDPFNDDGMF